MMATKTILKIVKKWAMVFAIVAFAVSAFLVIQNVQAYYGDYYDDCEYYGDCYDDDYDDCDYYGDCYDDDYDDCDYYGDCYDDYYDDCDDDCYDDDDDYCYECVPIDVCPNIAGNQSSVPSGYEKKNGKCVLKVANVNVTCVASKSILQVGESVTYTANATGGNGSYAYSWTGQNGGFFGTTRKITKEYPNPGSKIATVTVTSGGKTDTATCTVVVEEPEEDLNVSCVANKSSAEIGETVTYTANATGGSGSYSYSWSGTNGLSGASRSVSKSYSTSGSKTATVTVTSGGQTDTATCDTVIEEQEENLDVSCTASRSSADIGETVSFTANATGGTGNYSYSWSGTNGLSGTSRTVSKSYSTTGTKTATVTVTSGGQTETANCSTVITEEPTQDLNVTCSASRSSAQIGQTVSFTANATGGSGSYSYSWSGTNGLSGTSRTVSRSYSSEGTKTATVTVTSGGQTDTATCTTVIQEVDQDLNVICEVSDTRIEKGDDVTYRAIVTGGTGSYTYDWDGSSGLDGENTRTVNVEYNSTGNKHATVTVRSGGQTDSDTCSTVVVEDEEEEDFDVSCSASPRTVRVGETVTWEADVSGASGSKEYEWSGSDDLDGSRSEVRHSYDTPGTKRARVTVTVDGHEESDECTVNVEASSSNILFYQNPTPTNFASLSSVYLSQVPYTGPESMKYLGYILSLLVASIAGAFYVIKRKAKLSRKGVIEAFKQANLARRGAN